MEERREYFRVKDFIPLRARKVETEESSELRRKIGCGTRLKKEDLDGLNLLIEKVAKKAQEGDELFLFLSLMDKKLDMIMEQLLAGKKGHGEDNLNHEEVEISGSGMKFYPKERFEVGDLIAVDLFLPVFGVPKIPILCQVVRAGEEHGKQRRHYVAVKFIDINEEDRELLIKYLFRKERERLRREREAEG
jgi:hypothetical protein